MAAGQSTLTGASHPFRMGQNVKQTGHLADPAKQRQSTAKPAWYRCEGEY